MLSVTDSFTLLETEKPVARLTPQQIAEAIKPPKARPSKSDSPAVWPKLAEALCPDVQAAAVYQHIVTWIEHEAVDVLSRSLLGEPCFSKRRQENTKENPIQNTPSRIVEPEPSLLTVTARSNRGAHRLM